jgi:hypothetical protein
VLNNLGGLGKKIYCESTRKIISTSVNNKLHDFNDLKQSVKNKKEKRNRIIITENQTHFNKIISREKFWKIFKVKFDCAFEKSLKKNRITLGLSDSVEHSVSASLMMCHKFQ